MAGREGRGEGGRNWRRMENLESEDAEWGGYLRDLAPALFYKWGNRGTGR